MSARHIYGVNPILEALRARPDQMECVFFAEGQVTTTAAAEIFSRARKEGIKIQKVIRERLSTLAEGGVHQGVVAQMREFEYASIEDILEAAEKAEEPALVVVLDGIEDPQNLGAIIRSAYALRAHGVVIAKDRAASITGAVSKASAGALEHCPVAQVVNISRTLEELKKTGIWVVATDAKSSQTLSEAKLNGPLALVIGAEGSGIRENVLKHCDFRVRIPMGKKFNSLNASVSAAIMLYEIGRQRGH